MQSMKRLAMISLAAVSVSAFGSSVTIPNTFSTGTPAVASQVNANFLAVKNAVDDNNARLTTLESSIPPVTVNCTTDPNSLQTALGNPRSGKLVINFSGTCNPVFIGRSNVEIIGASRATAVIAGGTGFNNPSLKINNASYVKLKSLTIKRSDDQWVIAEAWRSTLVMDDVLVDHTTGGLQPDEGLRLVQSMVDISNSTMKNVGVYVGSSLVFENNNTVSGSTSKALEVSNSSSLFIYGNNNSFSSTGPNAKTLDVAQNSSFADMEQSTGNTITGKVSVADNSSVSIDPVISLNGDIEVSDGSLMILGNYDGPTMPITSNINIMAKGSLRMQHVALTGSINASSSISIDVNNSTVSNAVVLDGPFVNFQGNNVSLNGGGTFRNDTKISLNGASSMSGTFDIAGGYGWLDTPVDTFSAVFNSCGNISMQSAVGFPGYVCDDADGDGVVNYLDHCPVTAGSGVPAGCP